MKLYGSLTSPYARKVRVVFLEKGVPCEFILEGPSDPAGNVARLNPLGKVPVLLLADGETLFDSPFICDYVDRLDNLPLIPKGEARWKANRWHALSQGVMDAVVARMLEMRRTSERQDPIYIKRQETKVSEALQFADKHYGGNDHLVDDRFTIADIAFGVALSYIDLRYPHDWRQRHARLAHWFSGINSRPSFVQTAWPDF